MTLDTKVIIQTPTDAREVFDFCRSLLGCTNANPWRAIEPDGRWSLNPGWGNVLGQGLPALLKVQYGPDGPLQEMKYDDEGLEEVGVGPHDPAGFIEVSFDTAYSYRGLNGEGCGDLHSALVCLLGAWCDQRHLPWIWCNEFTGEWHKGVDGLDELGAGGRVAADWMRSTVMPAIAGEASR
jgi:hypothetical protein